MISVGINDNVFITSVGIHEKGFLEIGFDQTTNKKPVTAFEMLNQDGIVDIAPTFNMFLFTSTTPKNEDGKLTKEKLVERVTRDIKANKEILTHILMGYLPSNDANLNPHQFIAIDITPETFDTKILSDDVQKKIFENLTSAFITKIKPFIGKREHAFRFLLIRQGKDKHFASFRKNYINENPFWEPMEVTKEASKLKFTDYEIREGLTDATPVERSTADNKKATPGTTAAPATPARSAADVFGG
jgi:hypothetical protein